LSAAGAVQRFDLYCMSHPGTPAAVRRPRLYFKSNRWVALLGPSIKDGIAGFGATVESALSSFDTEYRNRLRPPAERLEESRLDGADGRAEKNRDGALVVGQMRPFPTA
jgi:hypothetical protein